MIFGIIKKIKTMKKLLLILYLIIGYSISTYAQNDLKAKIEFEEAEKAYNANDFSSSLDRLIGAEKLLGKTNSKILYLKILSQNQIITSNPYEDYGIIENIRKNCIAYMKLTDKKADLYDKYKEVYKIKQDTEQYGKTAAEFTVSKEKFKANLKKQQEEQLEAQRLKDAFLNDLFGRVNFKFEPDKTLEYYTSKYPEFATFIKKGKKTVNGEKTDYTFKLGVGRVFGKLFRVELFNVTVKDNKVVCVQYTLMTGKNKEAENISNEYQRLVQQANNAYGAKSIINPKPSERTYIESKELNFNVLLSNSYQSYNSEGTLFVVFYTDEMGIIKF